eukprot:11922344-Alexandrium_andersonii.AAC.1
MDSPHPAPDQHLTTCREQACQDIPIILDSYRCVRHLVDAAFITLTASELVDMALLPSSSCLCMCVPPKLRPGQFIHQ